MNGEGVGRREESVQDFIRMKESSEKKANIPYYDYPSAHFAEKARMDMLLVGDSLVMRGLSF